MADKQPDFLIDGISVLPNGMNSGLAPQLLEPTQTSLSTNCTHRGGFIRNRPGFDDVELEFDDEDARVLFENGLWQGGAFFKSEYGTESLVVSIGGRLFEVRPNPLEQTATVFDRTIPGDPNSSGNAIAWLWQAERWMIINDGNSLPIFFDGNTARRSRGSSFNIGTTALDFVVPDVGAVVSITLTAPYTGPVNETIFIDGFLYQVNAASTYQATMTNLSESAGTVEAEGSQVIIPANLLGQTTELQASGMFSGINQLVVTISSAPSPALAIGDLVTVRISGENYVSAPVTTIVNPQRVLIGPVPVGTIAQTGAGVYRGYFTVAAIISTLDNPFTTGAIGSSSTVDLVTPYTGSLPIDVVINGGIFRITAVNNDTAQTNVISVTNINDTPTTNRLAPVELTTLPELPVGKMGCYGMGRVWMALADGRSFIAGDIVGGPSGSPALSNRDAVLRITENDFLDGGGVFVVPGNIGDIQSMTFTANLDVSLGQGPLQIGTPTTIFSCLAPVDRTTWQTITNPILTESLKGKGPLGQYGTILVNSDTMFRAIDGIGSLILARRDFETWGNVPISREMQRVIDEDDPELLGNATAVQFDNRLLMGCFPLRGPLGVYHQGFIALNFDPVSSLRGKAPSIYDGLWTGLQAFQLISGKFSGDERAFAFVFESFSNKIALYELAQSGENEFDNGQPITWNFESASLFNNVRGKGQFDFVELIDGEVYLSDIQGVVNVQTWYRPNYSECWIPWSSFDLCTTENDPKQFRNRIGLGKPSADDCEPTNNRPYRIGNTFQVRFQITGACKFRGALFKARPVPVPFFAKPICDDICEEVGDEDCQECADQGECLQFDLVFYNLNGNKTYTNQELSFPVTCPDGSVHTVYVAAGTINFTLPFPPDFEGEYPPLVLGCSEGGNILRNIPSGSTQEQIDEIVDEMITECAQAQAEANVDCTGAPPQFENQEVYFTGLVCPEGSPINYSGTLPDWITLDVDNSRLVGAAGQFFANSQSEANLVAQHAIDDFGNIALGLGTLSCVSIGCVTETAQIVAGSLLRDDYLVPSFTASVERIVAGLSNNTLAFINTSTNAIIATPALTTVGGTSRIPFGCFATSVSRFYFPDQGAVPQRSILRAYDPDGNTVGASDVNIAQTVQNCTYSPGADRIFASYDGGGGATRLVSINPNTAAVVADINTGLSAGAVQVTAVVPGLVLFRVSSTMYFYNTSLVLQGTLALTDTAVGGWAYSPNTGKLYVGMFNATAKVWEIDPIARTMDFEFSVLNTVRWVAFEPNTGAIYSFGSGGVNGRVLTVIDPAARDIVCELTGLAGNGVMMGVDSSTGKLYRDTQASPNNLLVYEQ